jgi:hypothetical protein
MQDLFWTVGFIAFVGYIVIGGAMAKKSRNKRERAQAAKEQRVRAWKCLNCGAIYGEKSMCVFYGDSPDPAAPHCILVCDACEYLNLFDRDRNAKFGIGELFCDATRAAVGD